MRSLTSYLILTSLITLAAAAADFNTGLEAYQKKDYATAAKEWRALANKGDTRAQFNLGLLYVDGLGVPLDYYQAVRWFERSAQQDYAKAQLNLGIMYRDGKGVKRDYVQAYMWFNVCAAKSETKCVTKRDDLAQKLKPKQLATAQKLSSEFTPKQEPGKSELYNPDK
jgi:TPR repeat protein